MCRHDRNKGYDDMAHRIGRLACVLGGLACMVNHATSAAESGFYLGLDAGWVHYFGSVNEDSTILSPPDGKQSGFTWNFAGGYRFNRYVSLELGYVDLGQRSELVRDSTNPTLSFGDSTFSAHGPTLAVIGTLPLGKWDLFLKAGVLHSDTHFDFNGTLSGEPTVSRLTIINTHPLFGVGVGYSFTDQWRTQLGLTSYRDVGSVHFGDVVRIYGPNLTTATLGVSYRF
jgi:hypothetical protein